MLYPPTSAVQGYGPGGVSTTNVTSNPPIVDPSLFAQMALASVRPRGGAYGGRGGNPTGAANLPAPMAARPQEHFFGAPSAGGDGLEPVWVKQAGTGPNQVAGWVPASPGDPGASFGGWAPKGSGGGGGSRGGGGGSPYGGGGPSGGVSDDLNKWAAGVTGPSPVTVSGPGLRMGNSRMYSGSSEDFTAPMTAPDSGF